MAQNQSTDVAIRAGRLADWVRLNWGKVAIAAIVALLITGTVWPEREEAPPPPMTAPVTRGDIENKVAAPGSVKAGSMVDVGVRVTGQLTKLHVRLGDSVAKGDPLAEIDDYIQQTRVASAKSNLEQLLANTASQEASLGLSRGEVRRQERLMKERATTEVEYDRAVVTLAQQEAALVRHLLQIEQARAGLEEAQALLDFTRIAAPADGTVVELLAEEGQTLNAMQSTPVILRIGDLRTVRIFAKIAEVDMNRIAPGMDAYFTTLMGGARRWSSRLAEVSPLPSQRGLGAGVSFDALLEVENSDGALLPGMTARVFFLTEAARNVLKVPLGALTFAGGAGPVSASQQYLMQASTMADTNHKSVGRRSGGADAGGNPASESVAGSAKAMAPSLASWRMATAEVVHPDGSRETRQVHVGVTNNVEAEVVTGLSEGEMVVVGIPQPPMPEQRLPGFFGG